MRTECPDCGERALYVAPGGFRCDICGWLSYAAPTAVSSAILTTDTDPDEEPMTTFPIPTDTDFAAALLPEAETLKRIAESDMLVLASFMEGIPIVLMEAMSLRVPVIAPRVAGIPELIEDRETGLMFHPGDWHDLAKKLSALAGDPALRAHLIEAGQNKVRAEFSNPRAMDPLAQALSRWAR